MPTIFRPRKKHLKSMEPCAPIILASDVDINLSDDERFLRQENLYYEVDMQAICKVLNSFSRSELIVLDLGSGDGKVAYSRFSGIRAVTHVIGVDNKKEQIEAASSYIGSLDRCEKFSFHLVDLDSPHVIADLKRVLADLQLKTVDIIFSAMTFHHLERPERLLNGLRGHILSSDGRIIIREVDDASKIYYSSKFTAPQNYLDDIISEYKKVFEYKDRNCARKMYSWLFSQGFHDIEIMYDIIDTCHKSDKAKDDIFNITIGFRKARVEKRLENCIEGKYRESYKKIIEYTENMSEYYRNPDFWFCFTNYIAIASVGEDEDVLLHKRVHKALELYIIRHGQCESDADAPDSGDMPGNYELTEEGRQQVQKLTSYLRDVPFNAIYSSDYNRAYQTALPIAKSHNLVVQQFPELREIDRGDVPSDKMWRILSGYYAQWKKHDKDMRFPNGECGLDVWLRAKYVIDNIQESANQQLICSADSIDHVYRACIVTHGGTIRSLLCGLLNIPQKKRYQFGSAIDNCSITIVKTVNESDNNPNVDSATVLERFNDTSFLRFQ